jgi:hypothetical protein
MREAIHSTIIHNTSERLYCYCGIAFCELRATCQFACRRSKLNVLIMPLELTDRNNRNHDDRLQGMMISLLSSALRGPCLFEDRQPAQYKSKARCIRSNLVAPCAHCKKLLLSRSLVFITFCCQEKFTEPLKASSTPVYICYFRISCVKGMH